VFHPLHKEDVFQTKSLAQLSDSSTIMGLHTKKSLVISIRVSRQFAFPGQDKYETAAYSLPA
jgi:hypothetical protein